MNRNLLFFILVIAAIFVTTFLIYKFYEQPMQQAVEDAFYNISFRTYDSKTLQNIPTRFVVTLDEESVYLSDKTLGDGYLKLRLPKNYTSIIYAVPNGTYYTGFLTVSETGDNSLVLNSYGSITLGQRGELNIDNPINLTLTVNGTANDVTLCIRWSEDFIYAMFLDSVLTDVPSRFINKVDKCYAFGNLNDTMLDIPVSYLKFGGLRKSDFLRIYAIDGDLRWDSHGEYMDADINGTDIGIPDVNVTFSVKEIYAD